MLTKRTGFQYKMDTLQRQYTYVPNITVYIYMYIIHPEFYFYLQVGMHFLHTLL